MQASGGHPLQEEDRAQRLRDQSKQTMPDLGFQGDAALLFMTTQHDLGTSRDHF